jgi:hypothetical protein
VTSVDRAGRGDCIILRYWEDGMSSTGPEVFDKTLQSAPIWLGEIMAEPRPDRRRSHHGLRTVLHALRDRPPLHLAEP